MKRLAVLFVATALVSCVDSIERHNPSAALINTTQDAASHRVSNPDTSEVPAVLNQWHRAAGEAHFEEYFGLMTENSIYIGTDATENWDYEEFKVYSKPYFDRGKAWDFTPLTRNIYFSASGETAWFDELLDTHMGICRGSGTLSYEDGEWKIAHYVLSMTVPNEQADEITALKKEIDSSVARKTDLRGYQKEQ